jgi:hypothetical protein
LLGRLVCCWLAECEAAVAMTMEISALGNGIRIYI